MNVVERERELHRVEECIQRAVRGQGCTVVIEGAAGIGKTTVLEAVVDLADGYGLRCVLSQGGELEQELPFAIVRQLFEPVLRQGSPAFRAEILAGAAGLAAPLFDAESPAVGDSAAAIVHGLYWVCCNIAEHGPLLLVVDDAHAADESSLRFLSHLARRLGDLRVLLVLATRPGHWAVNLSRALTGVDHEVLQLNPLSDGAITTLVRREFGADAAAEFCSACAEVTGGNPFLLAEALIALREAGVDATGAAATRVRDLSSRGIGRSVLARLSRHGDPAQVLARAVAVLGPDAQLHRVAELAGVSGRNAARIVEELHRDSLLVASAPIRFSHPLVRSSVYADYAEGARAADHKRVVRILRAEGTPLSRLVPHLLAAERACDPEMVDIARNAAQDALSSGSPEIAVQCLRRALAEPAAPEVAGPIHARLGRALGYANRVAEAEAALREALALTPDPVARGEIAFELGWLLDVTGRAGAAKEVLAGALADLPAGAAQLAHRLRAVLVSVGFMAFDDPADWTVDIETDLMNATSHTVEERMLLAVAALGASVAGRPDADTTARLAAAAVAGDLAPPRERWLLVGFAGPALVTADRCDLAIEAITSAIDAARAGGDIAGYLFLCVLRSHSWYWAGNLLEAEADARTPLELATTEDVGALSVISWALLNVLVERGLLDEAEKLLESQGLNADIPPMGGYVIFTQYARGRLRMAQGRLDEALADLTTVGAVVGAGGYVNPGFLHWRSAAAEVYLALGCTEEARKLAGEEVELARRYGARRAIGVGVRTLGSAESGERQIALLRESAALLGATTARLEQARTLVDLGIALRRSGDREEAVTSLRQGLDLATRSRADALIERARAELLVCGARPRRHRSTGPAALTPSEHRVASLAVEGYSNREIAQRLFVSRRTVELHLTNAFRKLSIESRRELSAALASADG